MTSKKKKATTDVPAEETQLMDLASIYATRTVENHKEMDMKECAFDQNFRDDHDGAEVRKSIERVGLDPSRHMLWMEHPDPISRRPFVG